MALQIMNIATATGTVNVEVITPMDLVVGDKVLEHGAIFQIERINVYSDYVSCHARLLGNQSGSIPRGWLQTLESMERGGNRTAMELPDGFYWTVQGNELARTFRVKA